MAVGVQPPLAGLGRGRGDRPLPAAGPPPAADLVALHPWEPPSPRRAFAETRLGAVRHLTAEGDPRVVLGDRTDAGLLVVGPTGGGFLEQVLHIGSTTEWLLHHPPAPLVIARSARSVDRVLLAVDGSAHAARAAVALAALPWIADARVVVLGVDEGGGGTDDAIEGALAVLADAGATAAEGRKLDGGPTAAILEQASVLDVDLVALGTRGTSSLFGLRAGSTASAVARAARCSALVAEAPAVAPG